MPENTFALDTLIQIIWTALHGGHGDYDIAGAFHVLGNGLWQIMCVWAFANEAMDMAAGKGTNLPKLLLRWAVISAVLLAWPVMADNLYGAAMRLAAAIIPDSETVFLKLMEGYAAMQGADQAAVAGQGLLGGLGSLAALPSALMMHQAAMVGGLVAMACFLILLVSVAGIFMIFAMYLVMGPVFIALGMTDAFSGFMYKWIGVVLSFFLVIPLYGAALCIVLAVVGSTGFNLANLQGLPSLDHVFNAVMGPILAVGLILAVNRVAGALTGSYFGQQGSMAFTIGMAAAGIGARLGLSAVSAGAAAGGAAAVAGAGSAGSGAVPAATRSATES